MLPLLRIFKSRLALKSLLTWLVGWKFKEQIVPMSGLDLVRSTDNVTMSWCYNVTMSAHLARSEEEKLVLREKGSRVVVSLRDFEFWDFQNIKERILRLSQHQRADDVDLFTLETEGWWTCRSWRCSPCCSRSSRCCATMSSARCLERARLEMCPPCPENGI